MTKLNWNRRPQNGRVIETQSSVDRLADAFLAKHKASSNVSFADIEAAKTPRGGWTRAQLHAWGVPWPPPKGWKQALVAGRSFGVAPPPGPPQPRHVHPHSRPGFASNQPRPHWCVVCNARARDHVVTRGINEDGTLRAFWFCSQPHVDQWKADNPLPGDDGSVPF